MATRTISIAGLAGTQATEAAAQAAAALESASNAADSEASALASKTAAETAQGITEDARDEAVAAREGIVGDLGTTDSQTATLVTPGSGSLTEAALNTAIDSKVPVATTAAQGKVELATTAETQTGTDTARAVTPAAAAATFASKASTTTQEFAASIQVADHVRLSTDPNAMIIGDSLGTDGRRVRIEPVDQATSSACAQMVIIPGALNDPATSIATQIQLINMPGTNLERFAFSCVNNQYVIDSTYHGTGVARNICIQLGDDGVMAGGSRTAAMFTADASAEFPGGSFVADGKTWHAGRTKITDRGNTGDSRLVIDTRTGTPASNTADASMVEFRRGGSTKWFAGLNTSGSNADSWDVYYYPTSKTRMRVLTTGELRMSGDAPSDYGGCIRLMNTGTSGNDWVIGEHAGAGTLAFRNMSTGPTALQLSNAGSVLVGVSAPATTATGGFPYIPVMAGTPTGVPTAKAGYVPIVFDSTGVKLWIYTGGAWKGVVVA